MVVVCIGVFWCFLLVGFVCFFFPGIVFLLEKAVSQHSKQGTNLSRMYLLADVFALLHP